MPSPTPGPGPPPKWHARARSLGIDPDTVDHPPMLRHMFVVETRSSVSDEWEKYHIATDDRRFALHEYRRAMENAPFRGWGFRIALYEVDRWGMRPTCLLGVALFHEHAENRI